MKASTLSYLDMYLCEYVCDVMHAHIVYSNISDPKLWVFFSSMRTTKLNMNILSIKKCIVFFFGLFVYFRQRVDSFFKI